MIYKSANVTAEIASSILAKELKNSGIPTISLKNICSLVTDGEHQTPERSFLGIPLLTAKNVRDDYIDLTETDFVTDDIAEKCWKRYKPQVNDVLMTCVGTIGRVAMVKEPFDAVLVRSVTVLRPRLDIVLPEYLMGMLNAFQIKEEMQNQIRKSAQPGLYLSQVKLLEIPVPDLITQSLIAKFINWCKSPERQEVRPPSLPQKFEFIRHTIEQVDKIVAKIEEARRVKIDRQKEIEFLFESILKHTRLRLLQVSVLRKKLGEITSVTSGGTPSRSVPNYWSGNIPWIKTGELSDNDIYQAEEYITEEGVDNSGAKLFPRNTVLVALYGQGQTRGRTGRLMVEASTNQACCAILPTPLILNERFTQYWLRSLYTEMRKNAHGGAQPNWNNQIIKNIEIALLPLGEQEYWVSYLDSVQSQINQLKQQQSTASAELDALLPSILDRAFKGEL